MYDHEASSSDMPQGSSPLQALAGHGTSDGEVAGVDVVFSLDTDEIMDGAQTDDVNVTGIGLRL